MIAELVAAGCSGGDWQQVAARWTLNEYNEMQRHWAQFGPPAYVSSARAAGFTPKSVTPTDNEPAIGGGLATPEDAAAMVRMFGPGG